GLATGAALVVVALNLRIAIAAVSPVLGAIQRGTGISSTVAGLLTTVPVICFGVFALPTPRLIRRFGMPRLLLLCLVTLAAGIVLRLVPSLAALFAGTAVIGAAIAVANVLVPGLVKRDHPEQIGLMMGLYSTSLLAGAALSSGLTVPIEHAAGIGWRPALALWAVPAAIGIAVWAPHTRGARATGDPDPEPPVRGLWRDRTAWMVTGFMGMQSLGYFATLAWLPTLLEDHGASATRAGWMLSIAGFSAVAAALVAATLSRRPRWPLLLVCLCVALCAVGYLGLVVAPISLVVLWVVALGLGQGIAFSVALGFIVDRSPDSHHTAHLSTMAQSVGYLIASTGPFALGAIHDATSGWTVSLLALTAVLVPMLFAGIGASRDRHVLAPGLPANEGRGPSPGGRQSGQVGDDGRHQRLPGR
ncbi:MAG TPA: MFS transporter, partial [Acidimicrobiales bacterium]|nr:MFS transporter [Acidimicrobiales bacterium]